MDELVPRESWADFCERFTHQHHGWLVTLEYRPALPDALGAGAKSGTAALLEFRSLQLIDRAHGQELCITAADQSGREQVATVRQPVRLSFQKTPDGSHSGLRLDDHGGDTLILRFRVPARPEVLDGLAQVGQ
jgi:hypothetical protein